MEKINNNENALRKQILELGPLVLFFIGNYFFGILWGTGILVFATLISISTSWIVDKNEQPHEAQLLNLDISKAKINLDWTPKWNLNTALNRVLEWQESWLEGLDMRSVTLNQITDYEKTMES